MARKIEVLAVEDNLGDALIVMEMLNDAGVPANFVDVKDGRTALEILDKVNGHEDDPTPDLVILDLNLPRVQGFEVLRHMRESPSQRGIPVVVMTGAHNEEDEARARELGVAAYCKKPASPEEMDEVVGHLKRALAPLLGQEKRTPKPRPPRPAQGTDDDGHLDGERSDGLTRTSTPGTGHA